MTTFPGPGPQNPESARATQAPLPVSPLELGATIGMAVVVDSVAVVADVVAVSEHMSPSPESGIAVSIPHEVRLEGADLIAGGLTLAGLAITAYAVWRTRSYRAYMQYMQAQIATRSAQTRKTPPSTVDEWFA